MNENEVYELMDWASIEALVYSEHDNPHEILGAHATERGILIGAYVPEAQEITVITEKGGEYPMLCEDEAGYFAALLDGKRIPQYRLRAKHRDGSVEEYTDPYSFAPVISEKDCELFSKGIHYTVYEKLGFLTCHTVKPFKCHTQGIDRMERAESRPHIPSHHLPAVGIHDQGQIAEKVSAVVKPQGYIVDVAYP